MKKGKIIAIVGAVALLVIIIVSGVFLTIKSQIHNTVKGTQTTEYITQKAQQVTALTLSGHISPKQERDFTVTSKELSEMKVNDGQQVTQGQVLYTTYNEANATELTELKTTLAKDQRDKNQATQKLQTAKITLSKIQKDDDGYSDAQDAVTSATNDLDDLNDSISSTQTKINQLSGKVSPSITAPFAGNVTLNYDNNGSAKVTVSSTVMQATAQVSEYDYSKVKVGDSITVKAVATNNSQKAVISLVSLHPVSTNSSAGSKYDVYATIEGSNFIDGQTIKISIPQNGIVIPKSSLFNGKVFVIKNKKVSVKKVVGTTKDGSFVVTSGLDAGEKVVINPDSKLKEGEKWPQ
ncbi:MAG: hypothetical protein ABF778_04380 [Liquorilactobacillus hordei]|uniref:efflux RND transporter periplasmic adaptor subunit n=1 Tax=Liquorilactobacillus hordei TaxID=468911 RepID=UPI0039EBB2DF